jgi:transcription antitermination factor NusG
VPGSLVKVVNGPFKDIISTVEALSNSDRIAVLLDLMGRATRVETARQILEIAAA